MIKRSGRRGVGGWAVQRRASRVGYGGQRQGPSTKALGEEREEGTHLGTRPRLRPPRTDRRDQRLAW